MKQSLVILIWGILSMGVWAQDEVKRLEAQNKLLLEKILVLEKKLSKLQASLDKQQGPSKKKSEFKEQKNLFIKKFRDGDGDQEDVIIDLDGDGLEYFEEGSMNKMIHGMKKDPNQSYEIEIEATAPILNGKKLNKQIREKIQKEMKKVKDLDIEVFKFEVPSQKKKNSNKNKKNTFNKHIFLYDQLKGSKIPHSSKISEFEFFLPEEWEMFQEGPSDQDILFWDTTPKNAKKRLFKLQNQEKNEEDCDCDCEECDEY